jgi:hypothetical protein
MEILNKLILCLSILTMIGAISSPSRNKRVHGLRVREFEKQKQGRMSATIPDQYFEQKLDHFDDSNDSTFKQVLSLIY